MSVSTAAFSAAEARCLMKQAIAAVDHLLPGALAEQNAPVGQAALEG
ncbi:MAG: hypothetical protein R3D58_16280 [Saprospiraceae bacterium]